MCIRDRFKDLCSPKVKLVLRGSVPQIILTASCISFFSWQPLYTSFHVYHYRISPTGNSLGIIVNFSPFTTTDVSSRQMLQSSDFPFCLSVVAILVTSMRRWKNSPPYSNGDNIGGSSYIDELYIIYIRICGKIHRNLKK